MTKFTNLSMVRRFVFAPAAAIGIASAASFGFSAETQVHVRGGKMETRVENGKVVLTGLHGQVGGGRVHLAGNVGGGVGVKNAAMNFTDLPAAQVMDLVSKTDAPKWLQDVLVSGSVKGQWQGEGLKNISQSARGAIAMKTGAGVITDKVILAKLASLLKVGELAELRYDGIILKAHAADGRLVIDELKATGPQFKLIAAGNYSALADDLDIKIDLSVSQEIASQSTYLKISNVLGIFGNSSAKTVSTANGDMVAVPRLLVQGELKKPEVKLDPVQAKPAVAKAESTPAKAVQQVAFSDKLKAFF